MLTAGQICPTYVRRLFLYLCRILPLVKFAVFPVFYEKIKFRFHVKLTLRTLFRPFELYIGSFKSIIYRKQIIAYHMKGNGVQAVSARS